MIDDLFDEGAELAVLGAVLLHNDAMDEIAELLEPEHFRRAHHTQIFRAMRILHQTSQPIDPITLKNALARQGVLEDVGGVGVLLALADNVPKSANVKHYAGIVRDKAILRALCTIGRRVIAEAEDQGRSGHELLEYAEQEIYKLGQTAVTSEWVSAPELAAELFPLIEELNGAGSPSGIKTGFTELDRMTRGFQRQDLVLVGARPSMGKTALMMGIATHAAAGEHVAVASIETSRRPLALRSVSAMARVDGFRLMSGYANETELVRLSGGIAQFGDLKLHVDESPMLSPVTLRSKLRRLQAKVGKLGLVAIDYLQLMAPNPDDRRENRNTQLGGISRSLKLMAREFDVPFLVLSQLSRGFENVKDPRPSMSDLRDSGALEQDADVILLLHRPEYYTPDDEKLHGLAEVIVAKQRNGPTGSVNLAWLKQYTRFDNMAADEGRRY